MRLFCLKTSDGLLDEYMQENYVSIVIPWLEQDVEHVRWDQLCEQHEQAESCHELFLFVYDMQDEDLIIATDGKRAYVGDLGDYYFVEATGNEQALEVCEGASLLPPRLHRRGVTWLKPLSLETIKDSELLRSLVSDNSMLSKLAKPVSLEELEDMLAKPNTADADRDTDRATGTAFVDAATIREAVEVLQQALRSEDAERRERAAIALLSYAKK